MTTWSSKRMVAGFGAALGLWITGMGCQSGSLPFHAQGGTVLQAAARERTSEEMPKSGAALKQIDNIRLVSATTSEISLRSKVAWSVESENLRPTGRMSGTSFVGPDGTMQIGPYGTVSIAGRTPDGARAAVASHLAQYMSHPKITLTVTDLSAPQSAPQSAAEEVLWHPTRAAIPVQGAIASTSLWRPAGSVAAQKPDDVVAPASMQTLATGPELRLPQGSVERHPTAAPAPEPQLEAIPSAPAPVPDPLLHPAPIMTEHPGHMLPGHGELDVPREMNKQPLPRYIIEPPDILLVESTVFLKADQPIRGQHLVRPDGTVGLGIYGDVFVAGMTLERAREAIFQHLKEGRLPGMKSVNQLSVDVLAYNSKWYYVITDGGGYGEQVVRLPVTGNETVLDAISQINGLAPVSDKKRIWVARRNPGHGAEKVMPVDWIGISQHGATETNYQLMPGDRLYVKADKWRTFDAKLQKILSPIERALGVTLLGSETISSVRGRGVGTGSTGR